MSVGLEIEVETQDGDGISPLAVTKLGDDLYRVESGGLLLSDVLDFGDTVRLQAVEGDKYLLVERVELSPYKRIDWLLPREIDIKNPRISGYLEQTIYWELNFGGWLSLYVSPESTLDAENELTAIIGELSRTEESSSE